MSSEQVIKIKVIKSSQGLGLYLQTLYLLTVPADKVFGYSYPCSVI